MTYQLSQRLQYVAKSSNLPYYSDKVLMPQEILEALVSQGESADLPHPLIFRLSTPSCRCYAGVKEFVSSPGEIELPGMLVERLSLGGETPIVVELVTDVPKASALTLKPLELYAQTEADWKWFLEAKLSSAYTTLTHGEDLIIEEDGKIYKFLVSQTAPGRTVCIVDTDLNLDVEPLDVEMAKVIAQRREQEQPVHVLHDTVEGSKVKVEFTEPTLVRCNQDFAYGDRFVSPDRYTVSTAGTPIKALTVTEGYLIPLGSEPCKFEVGEESHEVEEGGVVCQFCGSVISKQSQFMHENFCRRNNVLCPKGCGKVFLREIPATHWHCCDTYGDTRESYELHQEYMHATDTCKCGMTGTRDALAKHTATECSNGVHECRFCHLIVARGVPTPESRYAGMSAHEYECGSKTTECYKCGKVLRRRDLESHLKLHELDRISKPLPKICSNDNCTRPAGGNVMGLCDTCFGPLFSTVYDPQHVKLRSRVERRYILQLKNGCGHDWCQNPLCGVSGTFPEIIKQAKSLVPKDLSRSHYLFCVDEAMTYKKALVDSLDTEQYNREWLCKAVDSVPIDSDDVGNISRVKTWLIEYGVKRDEY